MKDEIVRERNRVTLIRNGGAIRVTRTFADETTAMGVYARLRRSKTARARFANIGR